MSIALVLHSGGIDSSTCLYLAVKSFDKVYGVSIDYGQRHRREIKAAREICREAGCEHVIQKVQPPPKSMLTDPSAKIPDISYAEIKGVSPTYVPFRNGLLLSSVTGYAYNLKAQAVFFGAHAEDAQDWAYSDCTPEFIGAMANAIYIGTYHQVRLHTPLMWLNKAQIISLGTTLKVPFHLTWSCYAGEKLHCSTCPTCRARKAAFDAADVIDPTEYKRME